METLDYNPNHWGRPCPKYDCRKDKCKCGLKYVNIPAVLGDDSTGSTVAPKNGNYCNAIVEYEANGHKYIYSSEGIPVLVTEECDCPEQSTDFDYSISEIDTGTTWINGKKIYKKTIYTHSLPPSNAGLTYPHGVDNLGDVIKIEGWASYTYFDEYLGKDVTEWVIIPSYNALDTTAIVTVHVQGDDIVVQCPAGSMGMDIFETSYVTLYYTKDE